jgi:hypothetical protein
MTMALEVPMLQQIDGNALQTVDTRASFATLLGELHGAVPWSLTPTW